MNYKFLLPIQAMKRVFLILMLLIAAYFPGYTQDVEETTPYYKEPSSITASASPQQEPSEAPFTKAKRFQLGMEVGTSVGTSLGNGAVWNRYASPYLSYRLSPKWRLNAGTLLMNSQVMSSSYAGKEYGFSGNTNYFQSFVYAQGQYQVNDRLRLTGTAFYETSRFTGPRMNPQATNFNAKGMSMHAEFKITDNFSFGAGASFSNGSNPYIGNGLYGNQVLFPGNQSFNRYGRW